MCGFALSERVFRCPISPNPNPLFFAGTAGTERNLLIQLNKICSTFKSVPPFSWNETQNTLQCSNSVKLPHCTQDFTLFELCKVSKIKTLLCCNSVKFQRHRRYNSKIQSLAGVTNSTLPWNAKQRPCEPSSNGCFSDARSDPLAWEYLKPRKHARRHITGFKIAGQKKGREPKFSPLNKLGLLSVPLCHESHFSLAESFFISG